METSQQEVYKEEVQEDLYEPNAVTIKPAHFLLLYFSTFGLYLIWWMYKSWRYFNQKENLDIYPALRAFFFFFFGLSLFNKIADYCDTKGHDVNYNSTNTWGAMVVLQILAKLPHPFGIISLLNGFVILNVVKEFNFYFTGSLNGDENSELDGWKVGIIVLGFALWALVIVDLFVS